MAIREQATTQILASSVPNDLNENSINDGSDIRAKNPFGSSDENDNTTQS